MPRTLIVEASSEADFAFQDLYASLACSCMVWTTDGDWPLAMYNAFSSTNYRCVLSANDKYITSSTGALWSIPKVSKVLRASSTMSVCGIGSRERLLTAC